MIFTSPDKNKTIKTIRQSDPDFHIDNGIVMAPRAGFEISKDCPYNHLQILNTCIERGWIKPVAYIKEKDFVWEKLGE